MPSLFITLYVSNYNVIGSDEVINAVGVFFRVILLHDCRTLSIEDCSVLCSFSPTSFC